MFGKMTASELLVRVQLMFRGNEESGGHSGTAAEIGEGSMENHKTKRPETNIHSAKQTPQKIMPMGTLQSYSILQHSCADHFHKPNTFAVFLPVL